MVVNERQYEWEMCATSVLPRRPGSCCASKTRDLGAEPRAPFPFELVQRTGSFLSEFTALPHQESDFAFITKHALCRSFCVFTAFHHYTNFPSPKREEVAIMRFKRQISGEATRGLSVIWWRCLSPDVSKGGQCGRNESRKRGEK